MAAFVVVGTERLELTASRMSSERSSQLSYAPTHLAKVL